MFCWNFNSFNTTQILMCVLQSTSTQRTKNDKNKHISAVTTTKLSERTQIQTLHQLITKRFCWDSLQLSVFSSKHRMPLRWARDELMNCFFCFFFTFVAFILYFTSIVLWQTYKQNVTQLQIFWYLYFMMLGHRTSTLFTSLFLLIPIGFCRFLWSMHDLLREEFIRIFSNKMHLQESVKYSW